MIARIWRGATRLADKYAYHEYLKETGIKEYLACRGNRGVTLLRRDLEDRAEFLFLTLWDSYDAIKEFAGDDIESAVYYPEDDRFLLDRGPKIEHFEVLDFITK
jgi:heme-degrading monooxygenase HmoA